MVTLGCDKNRIDAELMLGDLADKGYNIVNDENIADVLIINTCGFIDAAKQESIDNILEMAGKKETGRCKALIACGCLAERYGGELLSEIPELDAVVGTGDFMELDAVIRSVLEGASGIKRIGNTEYDVDFRGNRVLTTPPYIAYVKISEGCSNNCSYCIIPKLRGRYRSRSMDNILDEVRTLSAGGVKEVILVAQDTSKYGVDIYGRKMLPQLLRNISLIDGIEWIRVLYCYPEGIDPELIDEMRMNDKVCKYIDIPLQHIDNKILRSMRRASNRESIENLIRTLREEIDGISIRTTFIVGYPGETEAQFKELYDFIAEYRLDRVGVFMYSREEDTDAAAMDGQISERVKKLRQRKLMKLQREISYENNRKKIGSVLKVLVEGEADGMLSARSYADAPKIDGRVYIKKGSADVGNFADVKITGCSDYDLVGEIVYESCK